MRQLWLLSLYCLYGLFFVLCTIPMSSCKPTGHVEIPKNEFKRAAKTTPRSCALDPCQLFSNLCQHGGTCLIDYRDCTAQCKCPQGFTGVLCAQVIERTTTEATGKAGRIGQKHCQRQQNQDMSPYPQPP